MLVTGIAPTPERLNERRDVPSGELVYLAKKALEQYQATRVLTSLDLGWEQALAKAAIELEIPFTVAIPFPGRDENWDRDARQSYLDLLSQADEVYRLCDHYTETAELEARFWQIDQADLTLALWDFDFQSDIFRAVEYAVKHDRELINLWEDWAHLFTLRRRRPHVSKTQKRRGAQVFDSRQ
jgi:hypothetical protein